MVGRNLFITLAIIIVSVASAASHIVDQCTAPIKQYKKIQCKAINQAVSSKEKVCKAINASKGTQAVTALASNYDPSSVDGDRKGARFITNLLNSDCTNSAVDTNNYVTALGMLAAPALFFFALNWLCCWSCTCCHFCCKICTGCKLCKCIPSATHEYTKCETMAPTVVWSLFTLLIFIFAAIGIANGVYELNDSLVGGICQVDNTYERFTHFLKGIKKPMTQLKTDFNKAVVDLTDAAKINPQLSQNVADITTKFDDIVTTAKNAEDALPASAPASCTGAWTAIRKSIKSARDSSETAAKDLDTSLTEVQGDIDTSIVGAAGPATDAITDGEKAIDDLQTQLDDMLNPRTMGGQNLIDIAQLIRENRDNMAFGAFGYAFIALFFGVMGVIGMKVFREELYLEEGRRANIDLVEDVIALNCMGRCCSRFSCCSWWLILFFGIFSAIFAAIWLPFAGAGRDMCKVLPGLPRDIGKWSGQDMVVSITDTCWNSTGNLFEGLDLDDSIDVDSINFDDFDNAFADVKIPTDGLDTLKTEVGNLQSTCKNAPKIALLNDAIDAAKTQCQFAENAFATSTIVADIKNSGKKLVKTIKDAIVGFKDATGCFFIACTWQETVGVICDGMIGSLGWLGTAQLFIAGLSVPFAIALMFVMKVMGGHGPIKNDHASGQGVEMGGISPSKGAADKYAVDDGPTVEAYAVDANDDYK